MESAAQYRTKAKATSTRAKIVARELAPRKTASTGRNDNDSTRRTSKRVPPTLRVPLALFPDVKRHNRLFSIFQKKGVDQIQRNNFLIFGFLVKNRRKPKSHNSQHNPKTHTWLSTTTSQTQSGARRSSS
jgi:hypothetical protein